MAGFYHTNGSNTSNISKKKKGFNHIGNAHTQNVLEYDGIKFGTVTNKGLKAIENNTLDSYTPATEEEKRAIRSYTAYKSHQETKAEEKQPNTFHPKDIVTSPFSQAVDKAKAEAEAKAKAEEKEAEESKKRFEAFKPNLSTTVNTSFGDVKVDTAPKFTETQINNYAKSQPRVKEKATLNSLYSMTSEEIKPHLKDKNSVAYTTIDGYNIKWKDLYDVAKSYEIIDNVKKSEDFPKASGYKKENFDYEFVKITGQKIIPENKEIAHLYNYINGDKEASNVELRNNIEVYNTSDTPKYKHLTDDEKATFNYLYNTGKTDEAKEFLDAISSELRSRRVEYENSIVAKDASKNPVGASVGSVIANVGNNALALPLMAVDYLEDGSIDENSSLYTNRRTVNTTRNTVENNIDNGVGKFFYRHGMNLADNVSTQAVAGFGSLGKVSKAMSGVIMSSGSFVDTTHDAKRRGLSDGKALALGVIAGGAEAYFESKSFDALWGSELLAKSGWGYFLDNTKTELAGELGTELTNDVADVLLSRDYNNFKLEYDGYIKAGDSKKEAWKKTFKTTLDKYGDIALGTIFTSGVMASPGTISVTVSNNNTGKTIRSNERIGEMFDIAQATSEKSSTHNLLSKYGKAGITAEHISDSQIGALYNTAKSEAYHTIMSKKATAEEKISAYQILTKLDEFTSDDTTRGADNTTVAEADAEETTPTVITPSTLNKGKVDTTPVVEQSPNEVPTLANRSDVDTTPVVTTPTETQATPTNAVEATHTTKGVTSAYTNNNQKIDMRYKVVSANDLIASNNIDGSINPNYPQELQPRERTRQASVLQVQNIANNIVPEKLGESANVSDGSPIVSSDNVVESGNGRTMALSLMYKSNPEGAKKYIEYIKANADKFGIDANNLPENPVLVRERLTDVDRLEFVKQANESNLSAMSVTELAKADSERLTSDILNLLVANDDGNLNTAENKAFVGRVISNVFSQNDLNSVVGANGMLSANGLERIQNALFYKAYNDVTLASKLSENLDNDIKNITKVLLNIAPKIVQVKNGIANGKLYDLDFSQDIVDGINYLQEAKRQDLKIMDFVNQLTIGEDVSGTAKLIAYIFEQKNRGAKQATLLFNHLFDIIMAKDPNQIGFLNEDVKTPTKENVLYESVDRYNNDEEATGVELPERFVAQGREEPRQVNDTRGIGDIAESATEPRPVDSESDGASEQQGYVEEETALTGNIDTSRQGERGTEERRPQNRTDETEVGAGELTGAEIKKDESAKDTPESVTKYNHLYDETKVSKEYLNSVNQEIENAIINIRSGNIGSVPQIIEVVHLDENTVNKISDFVGYDVSGYTCKIERDRLVHIESRHGISGEHDQSLSDPKDTARMGYVLNNSDNIEWAIDDKGKQIFDSKYNDRNNKISPVFVMQKRINGTYTVSQVVPDSKKKTLWITSARIEKADVGSQVPNADNSPQLTSKTPLNSSPASDNNIPQDTNIVKGSIRNDDKNDTSIQNAKNKPKSNETKLGKETPAEIKNVATELNLSDTEAKEVDNTTAKDNGTKKIADYVASKLSKGEKFSSMELLKVSTEAFGGTMANNVFSVKDAYDAMELGVNKHILSMKDVSAEKMFELLELLPTQTKRTEEMVKFQQFSTPPSIAYLANYVANVNAKDTMLEPSAGIGGIAVFAKRDGATVYVNELDNRRLEVLKNMPFDRFFNENAEQLDNILGGEIEPTVIVMNPPFSSSSERNMHNTKIGAKHIEQALKILAPNGRLVAIVGKGMEDGAPAFRDWWKGIKSEYNVRANIRIDGKNYSKYGTNFDIQMLVIDKNGATTHTEIGSVDTLQELQERLEGIRNERPTIDYKGTKQKPSELTRTETSQKGKTADVGNGVISDTDSIADNGKSTDKSRTSRKPVVKNVQSTDTGNGKTDNQTPKTANEVVDGRGELRGNTELQDSRGTDISDSEQHNEQSNVDRSERDGGTRQNNVWVQRPKRTELTDSIFEQYQTQPLKLKNAKQHPAKVSESAAMSAITPPAVTYKPHISQDIVEKGVVSDVQLEAISYAGQSHSQVLPNGTTRGFFLGDGTGIGKGRTIAGMMLDNYNQGRKKALWVTLNSSLVNDAKRDVKALFGNSDLLMQFEGGGKADKIFEKDEAILVVSYSTLSRGYDKKDSNFEKLVKWLGDDFDGLIVFDEAHKMGNATSTKGTRGMKKASQTGLAGIAIQEALPKARVVYSSATGATEVENLRYAERLGLWGEGTAFVTGDDLVSKIKAGGLASMELIARDMKAMGVYLSRNISYEDVQYDKITHNLTSQQSKIYDELARSWQIVLKNINKALESTNQDKDGHAKGRALGAFWSSQQRFFNQILTSMQVPSVISDIEKQIADGKSCVIQLVSTNESAQNQEFERLKSEDLELDEFDLTPKQVLMSMIENSFPVQQFEEYRDDEGNIKSKPVYDSMGNPVLNREAVRRRDELLEKLGSIKVPSSPIDMIINHFGTDLVAENTGRARRVIQKDGKTIEEKIGSKKDADVDAFQNGDKRIIIFSKAGGTGKSYHADKSAKNQQQRVHYLLEAGWQADNAVQGFGRSHRSNQASAPIFKLVTTNLKGQMRFISTIAKRLDQLGAMTKGQRQAGGQGMFSASDNLENSFASDVLAVFYKDLIANRVDGIDNGLAIVEKLGIKDKILDEYNSIKPTAPELREVNKFLNRILSLESSEQNTVFEGYAQRLQEATEKAMIDGTLDKGLENYKADKITLNEVQDIREDERSGAKTKYYNLTAEHKIKPVKFENVPTESKSFVGFYQNKNTGVVRAVMRTSSMTDQYGNVTDNFKLIGQVKNEYIAQYRLYGNWTKIDTAKAETLWNEELTKLPEYRKENLHLISGVVLPVWDKLPTENVRIYRVLTSDGKMLIGRVVSEDMIDETLRRLGSSRKREKIATKDLIEGIKNGDTVHLENGWKIVQRKVSGENRIELIGASYEHADLIKKKGVFTERIQYSTRYFIPSDTNTEKILDEILKLSPVMRVENSKYSSTDVSYDMSSSNDTRKTEYRNYTYNALTSKPDMLVTILDDVNVRDENGELNRADILKRGIENVRQKNNVKNTEENAYVYIPDIDRDVLVGKKGLSHSLTRNADVVALVTTKIGDILENSIKVNQLSPRENTIGGYILIGIATDKNKNYYPVRVVVNEYSFVEKVEVLDVLYAINAKKRKAGPQTRQGIVENSTPLIKGFSLKNQSSNEAELSANAGSPIKGSSVISISDLLELVKTEFSDVLTDDVLDNLGVERKESNLSDSIIYKSNTNNSYDQASANDRWKTDNAEHSKKKKSDVSLDRIVKKIRTKFGVPISTGKVPHKDARGVYKRKAEVIRTRIANNLPTIAHELGHHLDKLYKFSKMESAKKLTEALPQEFLSQYPTKEQGKEAVAEFVRTYLKSTTEAQKLSAEFYNDFVMTLSKEDLKALNEIASDFNYYLSMEIDEKYKSAIVNSKPTLRERAEDIREGGIEGIKDSVVDKVHDTYTKWVDSFDPIKQAVDFVEKSTEKNLDGTHNAYTLATNSLNATTIASYLVNDGFRDLNGNILEEMSFKECIRGVRAKDLNTLSEYLVLKHSLELINLDMRVFADETLEDVDKINKAIERIEREHPEMIEASENLYQYQRNMLKYYLVDSGLLSEEGFNAMLEKYPCYVPFYRDVSKKQGRAKGTFANQSTPIRRIKGSGASIINPLESIVKNTEKFVKSATRNQVMQVLINYANEAEGFGQFMEKVTPDMLPHVIDITRYKEKFTERLQQTVNAVDYFNVTNLLDEMINDTVMDFTPKANASKKLVAVMENGHASYYQIHDEALYNSIAEMTVPQLEGALKMISKIMLPMKTLMTQMNPLFATSNFFRDYGTAYKHSQINNPIAFTVRYMGALKSIITNDEMYQQYKAMGGGHSSKLATDIDQIKRALHDIEAKDKGKARQLAYAMFRHPLETITSLNDIVESIPRVLEFTKTLQETGDLQQAIYNADDITTNFKRHGSGATAKAVNQFVFFNNASLQGIDKTRRSLTGKDAVSKWTKWALFAFLSSALQYFWNRREDEEGYEQLSSYTKNNFYVYAIGNGKFVAIPKPRETAILDSFTERTIEYVFGNKDAFYDFGGYLADNLLPPMVAEDVFTGDLVGGFHDFFGGTVFGGLSDIGFNKDFMGRPIESKYEQNYLESWERYDEGTSKLAYHLGQTEWARNNDMSPKKIDHLLASSLGIIGSAIQAVFPMDETRKDVTLGLRNRFIKDSVYSTDVINKLWDNTEKAEAQFKFESTIENALEYEQNATITNFVSQMHNAIYALPLEEQREAKKLLLKELNRWDYELTTSQQQMKTSLVDRDIDSNVILDTLPKSLYEWTEGKQKYSYQMTPEEYVSFTKNYLKEIEKYRIWCKKTYTDQNEYIDNLTKANGAVMKYMRPYYNKEYKSKATRQ